MKILAIDTTSENLVIAFYDEGEIKSYISQEGSKKHNSLLMPAIEKLLSENNCNIEDVDYFACVVGPGSFTGIRIGVSTIKALSFATGKKAVAITSFEELSYGIKEDEFYVAIDCRHNAYYFAKYKNDYTFEVDCGEIDGDELDKKDCLVIKKSGASNPQKLIAVAKEKIAHNMFENITPYYLKKSQAEREYENKNMDKTV